MILSGQSDPSATTRKIGPALIFQRLWEELGLQHVIQRWLEDQGFSFEWDHICQDSKALQVTVIEKNGRSFTVGSECIGTCGKVLKAVGVAVPPTIQEL